MRITSSPLAATALLVLLGGCQPSTPGAAEPETKANASAEAAEASPQQNEQGNSQRPPGEGNSQRASADQGEPLLQAPPGQEDPSWGTLAPEGGPGGLDFIVFNRTSQTITAIAISPAGEESWSGNLLVPRDLLPGGRGAVSYTADVELCLWDIRATFEGGRNQSWPRVNLCETVRADLR